MKIPDEEVIPWVTWAVMAIAYVILRLAMWIMGEQL